MKKNVKKVLSTSMVLALGASILAGCGAGDKKDDKIELELFGNKTETVDTYKGLIAEFEKENPNIDVKVTIPPEAETVLKTRLTKNNLPDVMAIGGNATYGDLARSGALYDFSEEKSLDNIQEAYIDMAGKLVGSDKKGVYGIPYATNANGLLYNVEKLEKLGIEPPKTWDELIAALEKAKAAGETPIYFTLKDSWTGMVAWNSLAATLQGENFAEKRTNGETTFAETHKEVTSKFLELLKYGHKDNFGKGYGDGNTAFAKGDGVFLIQGVWALPEIQKANPDLKIGVVAFPTTNEVEKNKLVSGVDVILTMASKSDHPEEAKKLIEFLLEKENAQTYIDEQSAFSAIKDVYQEDPVMEGIKGHFENGTITSFPDHYYPAGMQAANLLQEFLIKKDEKAFLTKLDKEWDKVQDRK